MNQMQMRPRGPRPNFQGPRSMGPRSMGPRSMGPRSMAPQHNQHHQGNNGQFKKQFKKQKPASNFNENLKKFSAVQQVAILAPDAVIDVQPALQDKNSPLWKGVATFRNQTLEAYQVGKKKTRQAICSKVIKEFKLMDQYFGNGASLNPVGMHTIEVSKEEADEMAAKFIAAREKSQNPELKAAADAEKMEARMNQIPIIPLAVNPLEVSSDMMNSSNPNPNLKTPLSILSKLYPKEEKPKFSFTATQEINDGFEVECVLHCGAVFNGIGRGKKLAQHHAAYLALQSNFPQHLEGVELPDGAGTKVHPIA